MANVNLTHRKVSQTGIASNWKMDKASVIAALADFQKYHVADLDFFDRNEAVMASFANCRNTPIVQVGSAFVRNPAKEADEPSPNSTNQDAVRIYYGKQLLDGQVSDAPEQISSALLAIDITYTGEETTNIIPDDTYGISIPRSLLTPPVFHDPELDIYYFEDAFQHDIWGNLLYSGVHEEYGTNVPIPEVETWIENTYYYYLILDTVPDSISYAIDNEIGLNWGEGKSNDGLDYSWSVTTPAWTELLIVFNEARYWGTDKINRFVHE